MFSTLINNVAAAAQAILSAPYLPPDVQSLRVHAASFGNTIAPLLKSFTEQVIAFSQSASTQITQLEPQVQAWKSGDPGAHDRILSVLQRLLSSAQGLTQTDQNAYLILSKFRDQILADQRTVAQSLANLNNQLVGLRSQLADRRDDLNSQERRLSIIRAIPFPLPWIIAEIASLISTQKTLEQQISEVEQQASQLNGQTMQVGQAQATVQGFGNQLGLLESSMQNVINGISIVQGNLLQTVSTLQSGQTGILPIVLEGYLRTLISQISTSIGYLND